MPGKSVTFEDNRKDLLAQMSSKAKGKIKELIMPFSNDDVPTFLRKLDTFEKKSRKTKIVIG